MLFDMKAVLKEAQDEVRKEQVQRAKAALIKKMKDLAAAELVVANLKRELADLETSITEGNIPKA